MPQIASTMKLTCRCEVLLVDYAFVVEASGVPLVFIESENDSFSAAQEVGKLASVRSPVRALFSVVPWTPDPQVWPAGTGMRDILLPQWQRVAENYANEYGHAGGAFVAIVGEWRDDDSLVFYAHALGPVGEDLLPGADTPLWRRAMTVTQASAASAG